MNKHISFNISDSFPENSHGKPKPEAHMSLNNKLFDKHAQRFPPTSV